MRHFVKRLAALALLTVACLFAVAYAVDYGVFRFRLAANRAFGQVTVNSYEAVQQKSGKTEFLFNPPQVQTCVNSLFPRTGYPPCWYLQRHTEKRTDI
jgi:ABC-type spermidine/putrescine transport system permease subunit I